MTYPMQSQLRLAIRRHMPGEASRGSFAASRGLQTVQTRCQLPPPLCFLASLLASFLVFSFISSPLIAHMHSQRVSRKPVKKCRPASVNLSTENKTKKNTKTFCYVEIYYRHKSQNFLIYPILVRFIAYAPPVPVPAPVTRRFFPSVRAD